VRYAIFGVWFALTVAFVVMSISAFFFGRRDPQRLLKRLGLSLVWPLAMLSTAGRSVLLDEGKQL
jgi:hypothetical protein